MFRESLEELKKTRTITICGLFAAMSCLMGSFTIRIGNILKIGFSGLINELVSMFFGPVVGGVFGGMTDVLKYILRPDGAFLIGMTLNSALAGVIYGIFLYKKKISFWRILVAGVVVGVEVAPNPGVVFGFVAGASVDIFSTALSSVAALGAT